MSDEFSRFRPLHGETPHTRLADHPDGRHVALQITRRDLDVLAERAAVWDSASGKLVWAPEDVRAIAWTPDGNEVLLVRERYSPAPKKRGIIVTPLQSEFGYSFERATWPGGKPLSVTPLRFRTGWPVAIAPSPTDPLAGVVWCDQTEAGIEFVKWKGWPSEQILGHGFEYPSQFLEGAAFSPDGRHVALAYGEECWWSDDYEEPSPGGQRRIGTVALGDTRNGRFRQIELMVEVPRGWLPEDPGDIMLSVIPLPKFVDAERFEIRLPFGEPRLLSVND